jgi:predicted transcriptional regulator
MHIFKSETPTIDCVLKRIADDKALTLFNYIALSKGDKSRKHLRGINLTTKQYYSRISGLVSAGLIRRHKGEYSISLFGRIVFDAHATIDQALSYYPKLKSIESIADKKLPPAELLKIIDILIDNRQIKDILLKGFFAFEDKPFDSSPLSVTAALEKRS